MPKKIDPAVEERAVRLVREHRSEYPSLIAAAAAVAKRERLWKETLRHWALQDEVDIGQRPGTNSEEHAEIKALKAEVRQLGWRTSSWTRLPSSPGAPSTVAAIRHRKAAHASRDLGRRVPTRRQSPVISPDSAQFGRARCR